MLSTDRKFHFKGELNINKSKFLASKTGPEQDDVNWLFLVLKDARYSFVYKIGKNENVEYNRPFTILVAFTFYEFIENEIELDRDYIVQRGEEEIGIVTLTEKIK